MIELVYPIDPAPIQGESTSASEMFPIVEPNGLVHGQASREYCHSGAHVLHPVVHLQMVDRYSRFYLQHRSANKDMCPGLWDIAVGGHVSYGEMYEEALMREAREELGLYDFHPQYLDTVVYDEPEEIELANVYVAVGSYELHPDIYEVDEVRLWTIEEIEESLGKGVFTPSFEKEYTIYKDRILAML